MPDNEATIWGVHAGKTGDADNLFFKSNVVGVGWAKIGDLSKIKPDREAFKAEVAKAYPDAKPGAIPTNAGMLYRFVHEMRPGDVVLYPSKRDRQIHFARVEGPYRYEPRNGARSDEGYPLLRSVKWILAIPRTQFSQGALYEVSAGMSLFQIKTYAEEFLSALEGKLIAPSAREDPSAGEVAEDIEETTRDFILKRLARELKGHPLAEFVAHVLQAMGYRTRVSPEGPDGGIDIIAHKDELGFEPPIIKVQVKSGEGSVGEPIVSQLNGKVSAGEFGLLVSLGTFTTQAWNFARNKSNLRLIDGTELVSLIFQHYEQFDSRYKGLLPLKRVCVPQPIEEGND